MERRLQNWGRWKHGAGAGGLGYAKVRMGEPVVDGGDLPDAIIPTVNCEAEETDQAIWSLSSELRATIEVYYVQGGSIARKAKLLAVAEPTIHSRLRRARPLIERWVTEKHQQRRAERERTEALQQSGRPIGVDSG
nr:hypothetical protein [uncultured Roseateles sp.]